MSEKGMIHARQSTFTPETFGKRQKGERSPVVSLLPGSHECLALRNPRILCQKNGGAYNVLAWSAKSMKKGDKKSDSCAAKKGVKKLVISVLVKILE